MKEEIQLYEIDEAWTPQYPVTLEGETYGLKIHNLYKGRSPNFKTKKQGAKK